MNRRKRFPKVKKLPSPPNTFLGEDEQTHQNPSIKDALIEHGIRPFRVMKKSECGKSAYSSESAARQGMRAILRKGANVPRMRAYFCEDCKHWHLTSTPKNRKERQPGYKRQKQRFNTDSNE